MRSSQRCQVNGTLDHLNQKPSEDDWGTFAEVGAQVSFGILCHEFLPDIVEASVQWQNADQAAAAAGDDQDAVRRQEHEKVLMVVSHWQSAMPVYSASCSVIRSALCQCQLFFSTLVLAMPRRQHPRLTFALASALPSGFKRRLGDARK